MQIYPAIDLRDGKVVRLQEGDPNQQTTFSSDPVATAQQWIDSGATWIHMVNLDGAFSDANDNGIILEAAAKLNAKIQFGGGLRSMKDIKQAVDSGASRVVLGTVAVKEPQIVLDAVKKFGTDAICVALDARDGVVMTHGWTAKTDVTPIELGRIMMEGGVKHALFTDVSRDGKLTGVNIEATVNLGRETGLQVIASGGVSTTHEIKTLAESGYVAGAVIGMALYEGKLKLEEAIAAGGSN